MTKTRKIGCRKSHCPTVTISERLSDRIHCNSYALFKLWICETCDFEKFGISTNRIFVKIVRRSQSHQSNFTTRLSVNL